MMESKNTLIFETDVVNIASLQSYKFSVPTYQRPYVWGEEEIKKLLLDFYRSYQIEKTSSYYIGTILIKENEGYSDLIDGQQRFTTLWLTAFVFKKLKIETQLIEFLEKESELRIGFEIRKEIEVYLNQLLAKSEEIGSTETLKANIEELPYLENIAKGLTIIENIIKTLDKEKMTAFGDYVYNNIHMVANKTPQNIDLNKLFSTINSSGIQLEQTDIVKSKLLRNLGDQKVIFSKIWEACEDMNSFFEKNAKTIFSESDWKNIDMTNFYSFDPKIFKYKPVDEPENLSSKKHFSIDSILSDNDMVYEDSNSKDDIKSKEIHCRSIINFGQLLLHTYRIHLKREGQLDFKGAFHVNRLIEVFDEMVARNDNEEIKRFFYLLWNVRFAFDKFIVKWISDVNTKTEHLELMNISLSDGSYSRTPYSKSNILMLQSVLYFTGDYLRQFWLTPFLNFILNKLPSSPQDENVLPFLEMIDNKMSTCNDMNDKEVSFLLLSDVPEFKFDIKSYLYGNKGTSFKHYWFQKLEYILWKDWKDKDDPKFENFRITSKNSVEHIHPQSKADTTSMNVHDFGNLVLLSVSQNSEYGSKDVNVKKAEFGNKKTYDSLKSYFIFQNIIDWDKIEVETHRNLMIKKIIDHYDQKYPV